MDKYLHSLRTHPILSEHIRPECSENEICVSFDEGIDDLHFVIIKVDDYYNSLGLENTPPSPDCLIVLKCKNDGYSLTIVELKSITSSKGFSLENIVDKFNTCLQDFIEKRFDEALLIDYKKIKLIFVTEIEIYKRDVGLKMESLINSRFTLDGRRIMLTPYKPIPTIKNCY